MPIETITRAAKKYYEELYLLQTQRQFFYTIFGILDESTEAGFLLDTLIGSPYAITYRQKNGQSHVRKYSPGSGILIEPPIASEKTPLTEELLDKIVAGVDAAGGFSRNEAKLINDIIRQHTSAMNMTKNYQAMQVLLDGVFQANGPGGVSIGLGIDFSRVSGNNLTYDFTVGGNTITIAFTNAIEQLRSQGCPLNNMVAILGTNWVTEYNGDSAIAGYMQNNNSNLILGSDMVPPELLNTEGLYIIGRYRGPGMIAPLWLCSYSPPVSYVKDEGETAESYIGANECAFFALPDERYRVNRGLNVIGANGKRERVAGDMVIDRFSENDPVTEYLRSSTRHVFVPGNKNHTAKSTGTFS